MTRLRWFVVLLLALQGCLSATWPSACKLDSKGEINCECGHEYRIAAVRDGPRKRIVQMCGQEKMPINVSADRAVQEPDQ